MEFIKLVAALFLFPQAAGAVASVAEERAKAMMRTIVVTIIVSLTLLGVGFYLAATGYSAFEELRAANDPMSASAIKAALARVTTGRGFIMGAAIAASILLLILWAKFAVNVFGGVVASNALAGIIGAGVPKFTKAEADDAVRWLRGVTVWLTLGAVWASWVPIYKRPALFLAIIPVLIAIQGMMSAKWFQSMLFRRLVAFACMVLLIFVTVAMTNPKLSSRGGKKLSALIEEKLGVTTTDETLEAVEAEHRRRMGQIRAERIEELRATQRSLICKKDAGPNDEEPEQACNDLGLCFCAQGSLSAEDVMKKHADLEERIKKLLHGKKPEPEKKAKPQVQPTSYVGQISGRLPPLREGTGQPSSTPSSQAAAPTAPRTPSSPDSIAVPSPSPSAPSASTKAVYGPLDGIEP